MSSIEEQVKSIVAEQLGVKEEEVTNDASFVDDLGADSLKIIIKPHNTWPMENDRKTKPSWGSGWR